MQFPLASIDLASPRVNKRNPQSLHWRANRPKWHGCLETAYHDKYSNLQDNVCCLQCGAVPCPYEHEEERKQRLQDLEFVRELAKERKDLSQQLKQLKDELNFFHKLQKEWESQKSLMEAEIKRLHYLHEQNLDQLRAYSQDKKKLQALTQQLEDLRKSYDSTLEENKKFRQMIVNQSTEIDKLEQERNVALKERDQISNTVRILRVQLDESKESLDKAKEELWDSESRIRTLQDEMRQLIEEIEEKTKAFETKEAASQNFIERLRSQVAILHQTLSTSQEENCDLRDELERCRTELEMLRRKLSSDRRFQQFVNIKREVNELKDKNESLMCKVSEQREIVPVMKKSGRVVSANSAVKNGPVLLNRPKSSRTLRPSEDRCDME